MAVGRLREAVDDFVKGAVAATSDDQLAMFADGLLRDFGGVAGAGGFREIRLDTVGGENLTGLIDEAATTISAVTGVGIVDEQSVLDERVHGSARPGQNTILTEKEGGTERAKRKKGEVGVTANCQAGRLSGPKEKPTTGVLCWQ